MALTPDAAALVEAMQANGLTGFASLGVEGARKMVEATSRPGSGPSMHRVDDLRSGIGDVPVRVYRPSDAAPLPVVIFFHGGGWVLGSLDSHDLLCRQIAAATGAAVVAADYRLAPEHPFPAAVEDVWATTRWVFEHGHALGLDAEKAAVAGDSAGGNLAAVVARLARDAGLALRHQVLIYPVIDRRLDRPSMIENATGYVLERADMDWFWAQYDPDVSAAADPRAVPIAAELCGVAPALVITAEHDPLRDEGEDYAARLRDHGVPTTLRRYDGVFHGFMAMSGLLAAAGDALATVSDALGGAFE